METNSNENFQTVSNVPDLIHSTCRQRRIDEIKNYFRTGYGSIPEALHRMILFVTYRCNLRCVYCKTISRQCTYARREKQREYDLPTFEKLLESFAQLWIRHIHFTGGEATRVRDFPAMVRAASRKGITCSLTTNGTAPPGVYRDLVKNGLREVRISIDTPVPEDFDKRVGVPGTYRRVMKSMEELVRLRDEDGREIFIIINVSIGYDNRDQLSEIIKQFAALGPNDIKLITLVQAAGDLGDFEERQKRVQEVRGFLDDFDQNRFPLLRYKLRTLFDVEAIGLKDKESRHLMKHCFIPLTERTMDMTHYYPCSIYLREGGEPLGNIWDDSLRTQQKKIFNFIRSSSCLDDPICREYCINCCKKFNLYGNSVINHTLRDPATGVDRALNLEARCTEKVHYEDVLDRMQAIEAERRHFPRDVPYRPFLVIKPSGMPVRARILELIRTCGIAVAKKVSITDWNETALRLYSFPLTEKKIFRGLILSRVLPGIETTSGAELLWLGEHYSIEDLEAVKTYIRSHFPPIRCLVHCGDDLILTTLGYLHSPTEKSYFIEHAVLSREGDDFKLLEAVGI